MESTNSPRLLQPKGLGHNSRFIVACCLFASALGWSATMSHAQSDEIAQSDNNGYAAQDTVQANAADSVSDSQNIRLAAAPDGRSYAVDESPAAAAANAAATTSSNATAGPVRLARFSYVSGNVTWRPDDTTDWSPATVNLPVRQGAQFWITGGGRAEIQFDDGSLLRLGNNALVTLQTLYSDTDGEFTEIKLNSGLVSLRLRTEHSIYQVDTPLVSAKATGPAKLRLGAGTGANGDVEVAVSDGQVNIEGSRGTRTLQAPSYLVLNDANTPYVPASLPDGDSWEHWNADRDNLLNGDGDRLTRQYVPENIGIVAGDLDHYGDWRDDPRYGHVWCPRETAADWRPYNDGHWTWVAPFGWTWVADEPWGWAPYHYGTWIHEGYGWAWVPGPVNQYWCPAVVNFSEYNGGIGWCPLAPFEVRYPSFFNIGLGFGGRRWSAFFSIGCAGYYYPYDGICIGRPWDTGYINRSRFSLDIGLFSYHGYGGRGYGGRGYDGRAFVPYNARLAAGGSFATVAAFGGRGRYESLGRGHTDIFTHGRGIVGPGTGRGPIGPLNVRPTLLSASPSRRFETGVRPSAASLDRAVVRAPLRPSIARVSAPFNRGITPSNRPSSFNHETRGSGQSSFATDRGRAAIAANATQRAGLQAGRSTGYNSGNNGAEAARRARSGLGWTAGSGATRSNYTPGNHSEIGSAGRQTGVNAPTRTSNYGAYEGRQSAAGSYAAPSSRASVNAGSTRSDSGYRNRDDSDAGHSASNYSGGDGRSYGGDGGGGRSYSGGGASRSDYGGGRGGGGGGRHR